MDYGKGLKWTRENLGKTNKTYFKWVLFPSLKSPFLSSEALFFNEAVLLPNTHSSSGFTPTPPSSFDREAVVVPERGKGRNYRFRKCLRDFILHLCFQK